MPTTQEQDLFESSKMTFGEHLDELRSALMKALLALVAGFLVGLLFGGDVVAFLQTPVVDALEDYYTDKAVDDYVALIRERLAQGQAVPPGRGSGIRLPPEVQCAGYLPPEIRVLRWLALQARIAGRHRQDRPDP